MAPTQYRRLNLLAIVLSLTFASCNPFSGIEQASEPEDLLQQGLRLASDGECYQARDVLLKIYPMTDDVRVALGWAHLCIAGATAKNIAISIYRYSSTSSDTSVIGSLARRMLPMSPDKIDATGLAIGIFSDITDSSRRNIEVGIARFARGAAVLANQATTSGEGTLEKADISTTCNDACATCAVPGMTDQDVTEFANNVSAAASALSSGGATDLQALANALNSGVNGASDAARCYIYKQAIPAD